jgi:hypothetical protein
MNLPKNLNELGPLLKKVLPILQAFGIDLPQVADNIGTPLLASALEAHKDVVVAQLVKDGWTEESKRANEAGERAFIRSAMFVAAREALRPYIPKPVPVDLVADAARDRMTEPVVLAVAPKMDEHTDIPAAVGLVIHEFAHALVLAAAHAAHLEELGQ